MFVMPGSGVSAQIDLDHRMYRAVDRLLPPVAAQGHLQTTHKARTDPGFGQC